MADGGRKRKRFTPHSFTSVMRQKSGSSLASTTRDLFGNWSVTFPVSLSLILSAMPHALSPIIQISDRLDPVTLVTPGILCSLLTPRKVQRLLWVKDWSTWNSTVPGRGAPGRRPGPMVPVNRLIMLAKNNAELTFEPHSAPPKCILWDVFWVFPSLPRFPAYLAGTRWKILPRSVKLRSDWYDTVSVMYNMLTD